MLILLNSKKVNLHSVDNSNLNVIDKVLNNLDKGKKSTYKLYNKKINYIKNISMI